MATKVAIIVLLVIVIFLLVTIITLNIKEWYDPFFEVITDKKLGRKCLVLWYNKITDVGVIRDYKTLLKL